MFGLSLRRLLLLATGALAILPTSVRANSLALDFVPGPGDRKVCAGVLAPGCTGGWSFAVIGPIEIVSLGVWDEGSDGLLESHEVGLWTGGGTLLTSILVTNAATAVGSTGPGRWLFAPIAPLVLSPGN